MLVLTIAGVVVAGTILTIWIVGERGSLMRPSTWKMIRAGGRRRLLTGVHGYIYGRWTNQYLRVLIHQVFPRLRERGKRSWRDRYHGKILTAEHARAIVTLDRPIERVDLDQVVPYRLARELVLSAPPDIAVIECGCRHAREESCQPTKVCMVVGQPFVDFKDACLDRFYAICNCCKCCCGGIEFMMKHGNRVLASSGYVAQTARAGV